MTETTLERFTQRAYEATLLIEQCRAEKGFDEMEMMCAAGKYILWVADVHKLPLEILKGSFENLLKDYAIHLNKVEND